MAKKNSDRKERLLIAAKELMLQKGYAATRVEEICKLAGVTKGSFFHYFKSKEELGKNIVTYVSTDLQTKLRKGGYMDHENPLDRFLGFVDFAIQVSKDPDFVSGCIFGNLTLEFNQGQNEIKELIAEHFSKRTRLLAGIADEILESMAEKPSVDTKSLVETVLALIQGALVLGRAKSDFSMMEKTLTHYKTYVKMLFENP